MPAHHSYRIQVSYQEIFRKGTIALAVTFLSGILFGRLNMMIAFVIVLGSSTLSQQNFRIRLVEKTVRLILFDMLIVCLSFAASQNIWWGSLINLSAIFLIIYITMSPYDHLSYKTFMMLYVFCQYTKVTLAQLPTRLAMTAFAVSVVVLASYQQQKKNKSLLPASIGQSFKYLEEQFQQIIDSGASDKLYEAVNREMRTLAYVIYQTSYRRYFTTFLGRVQFHFYLNLSYLNLIIMQLGSQYKKGYLQEQELAELKELMAAINCYFARKIKRQALIGILEEYLKTHETSNDMLDETGKVIYALKKNFEELDDLDLKWNYKVYNDWCRSDLSSVQKQLREYFNPKRMSFNFALRMTIILTISLLVAGILGFYKLIWVIIPIMSVMQPYYEDTKSRRNDRIFSNVMAAAALTIILELTDMQWIGYAVLVAAFYLVFAYKDYYHYSFFITIISMYVATADKTIDTLLVYRVIYVLIGALIVTAASRVFPYRLKDGIEDLMMEAERVNNVLEEQCLLYKEGKESLDLIREAIVYSALLCQKLQLKNKQYRDERVDRIIIQNTEFAVRLGHRILREPEKNEYI